MSTSIPVGGQRPADGVHAFALGEGAVLYVASDQELHVLNATAALVWSQLARGAPVVVLEQALCERFGVEREQARAWASQQLRDWRARGFLTDEPSPARATPLRHEGRSRREDAGRPTGGAWPRPPSSPRYRLLDTSFAVDLPPGPAGARVRPVIAHMACADDGPVDLLLTVERDADGYRLLEDGRPVAAGLSLPQLVPVVKLRLRNAIMNRHRYFMQLHAGAVLDEDGVLLFPGDPGSGKTTLTASLVASGLGYLSDEVVLLERGSLAVRPFPLALTVKSGAVAPLTPLYPMLPCLDVHEREDGRRVRYLRPPAGSTVADDAAGQPVRAVIFPRYAPDAPPTLSPVEPCEALQRLLACCLSLPEWLSAGSVEDLVRWMRRLDCWELRSSSVPEAIALVRRGLRAA